MKRGKLARKLVLSKDAMPANFVEKTFTYSHKTSKFAKVFSLKSFLLYMYGIYYPAVLTESLFFDDCSFPSRKAFLAPLNLPVVLQDALLASQIPPVTSSSSPLTPSTPDITWQLLLLCPTQQQMSDEDGKTFDWLKGKLRFEQCEDGEATSNIVSKISISTTQIWNQASRKLQIAVKAVCGDVQEVGVSLRQELLGTSAVAVYIPTPMANQSPEVLRCCGFGLEVPFLTCITSATQAFTAHILSQMSETVIPLSDSPSIPLLALCSSKMEHDHLAHWMKLRMGMSPPLLSLSSSSSFFLYLSFPLSSLHALPSLLPPPFSGKV